MAKKKATEPETSIDGGEVTALVRLDPQALLTKALESSAPIETLERLVALAKDVRAEQAKEAWHDAMAEFQRRVPPIRKTATADTGRFKYKYAPLDEILTTVLPVMGELGLSVSWRGRVDSGAVLQNCRVSHALGHFEESGEVRIPIEAGSPDKGATPPQRVGIATTYAKRYSLLSIIGLAPEDDDDAASASGPSEPTVAQPRRASERPAPPPPEPETIDVASTPVDGPPDNIVFVRFVKSETKTGTNRNGPWTLWTFSTAEGEKYGTFSESMAAFILQNDGKELEVLFDVTERGNKTIVEARLS